MEDEERLFRPTLGLSSEGQVRVVGWKSLGWRRVRENVPDRGSGICKGLLGGGGRCTTPASWRKGQYGRSLWRERGLVPDVTATTGIIPVWSLLCHPVLNKEGKGWDLCQNEGGERLGRKAVIGMENKSF